jgi:hypothetical protein
MYIELTIKNLLNIEGEIAKIKELKGITEIGLTDKNGMPDNLEAAKLIKMELPLVKFTTYYSLKNHTNKDLKTKLDHLKNYLAKAGEYGVETVLLVSGNPHPKFDTIEALKLIKAEKWLPENVRIAVAYNPFEENIKNENMRLSAKVETGLVSEVSLQIGTFESALEAGQKFIQNLDKNLQIKASLIVPTPYILTNFKFRPWKGVKISDEFLSSPESAAMINDQLVIKYKELNIVPIFGVYTINETTKNYINSL